MILEDVQPKEVGLPQLMGTEEDVQLAELVRFNVISKNMQIINQTESDEFKEFAKKRLRKLSSEKSAFFWVSKRDRILTSYEEVFRLFQEEMIYSMARE